MLIKLSPFSLPRWLLMVLLVVTPFLYLPLSIDSYHLPRQVFIFLTGAVAFLYWSIISYQEKRFRISISRFDLYPILLFASIWVSFFLSSLTVSSLTSLFGPVTFSTLILLYFFTKTFAKEDKKIILLLFLSSLVFILLLLFPKLNFLNQSTPSFIRQLADQNSGWYIAAGNLKNLKNAVFGIGPGNFPLALAQNRPGTLTSTVLSGLNIPWQTNLYFQILTEYGVLGLGFFLLFCLKSLSNLSHLGNLSDLLPRLTFLLIFAFWQPNLVLLMFFFLILAIWNSNYSHTVNLNLKIPLFLLKTIFLFSVLIFLSFIYLIGRFYLAEVYYKKAFESQQISINKNTYQDIVKALELNDANPLYHLFLSRISLVSALSYAKNQSRGPKEEKILQSLFNQAIGEGQKAINLAPNNASFYFNLAEIYFNSLGYVLGASDFAITNYNNALSFDPKNPNYHFGLGKAYQSQKKFDLAERQFEITTVLDSSFANAYYNLYYALRQQGLYQQALSPLEQTKNLLPSDHPQFSQIVKELKVYENFVKEVTASGNLKNLEPPPISTSSVLLKQNFGQL
ncbi:tetratricopeptide repeat protein [Candidatus Gottesmanbacteria bacterium]|nr:tetratricopeptide repeat protein [Candidatus Gottesmanbacteria bacterium]